ncbi:Uncharacterised protein [Bordetella bronchiseptica]|nr:Uncharacterised protein [Bordetella bronchiseptica]
MPPSQPTTVSPHASRLKMAAPRRSCSWARYSSSARARGTFAHGPSGNARATRHAALQGGAGSGPVPAWTAHGRGSVASPAVLVGLLHDQMVMKMSCSPDWFGLAAAPRPWTFLSLRIHAGKTQCRCHPDTLEQPGPGAVPASDEWHVESCARGPWHLYGAGRQPVRRAGACAREGRPGPGRAKRRDRRAAWRQRGQYAGPDAARQANGRKRCGIVYPAG